MTDEELKNRQVVWAALSRFYLDTELDDTDYNIIARKLRKSNYKLIELKEIDLYEVFPVLQMNLLSLTGEWAGFDEEWLNEMCLIQFHKRENKQYQLITKAKNKLHYWMRKKHWTEIEQKIEP